MTCVGGDLYQKSFRSLAPPTAICSRKMNSRTSRRSVEEYPFRGAYLARLLLFFCRRLEARTAGSHSLDRRVAPLCSCHISANASHIELCALSNQVINVHMAAYLLLICLLCKSSILLSPWRGRRVPSPHAHPANRRDCRTLITVLNLIWA